MGRLPTTKTVNISSHNLAFLFLCFIPMQFIISQAHPGSSTIGSILHLPENNIFQDRDVNVQTRQEKATGLLLLLDELSRCHGDNGVVVMGETGNIYNRMADHLLQLLSNRGIKFIHIDDSFLLNDTRAQDLLYDFYVNKRILTYVLLTSFPSGILASAQKVFERNKRRRMSAMPHLTHWLVIVRSRLHLDQFLQDQISSVFDHVTAILAGESESERPQGINMFVAVREMVTLEWQADMFRRPAPLSLDHQTHMSCDNLFPNRKHGMNGRVLSVLAKSSSKTLFDFTPIDESSNSNMIYKYTGLNRDILELLSQKTNFSYVFTHPPEKSRSLAWLDVEKLIINRSLDLGVNLWPSQSENMTVTHPVLFDFLTGIYLPPSASKRLSTFLMCPFPPVTFAILGTCLVFVAVLYVFTEHISMRMAEFGGRSLTSTNRTNPSFKESSRSITVATTCRVHTMTMTVLKNVLSIVASLINSVLNQETLPRHSRPPGHVILGVWSLGLVVFYAIYTGYLTSNIVAHDTSLPFNTYTDMMTDGRYRWGTEDYSYVTNMFNTTNKIVKELWDNIVLYDNYSEFHSITLERVMHDYHVFLYYETYHKLRMSESDELAYISSQLVYMKDKLFAGNMGYALAQDNELEEILSRNILTLHESGLISHLLAFYTRTSSSPFVGDVEGTSSKTIIQLEDVLFLLVVTGSLLMLSSMVLVMEMIVDKRIQRRRKWME